VGLLYFTYWAVLIVSSGIDVYYDSRLNVVSMYGILLVRLISVNANILSIE